ncbi:hypothetical protein GQ457_12G018520 [Hibiscus cannabinus]
MLKSIIASWNIRGLGRLEKRAAVKRFLAQAKVKILFLQESKLSSVKPMILSQICGAQRHFKCLLSPSVGSAGGLLTLWDPDFFECEKYGIAQNFIWMSGKFISVDFKCLLVNVYGQNDVGERLGLFHELSNMVRDVNRPVILGGDFNTVRRSEERIGMSINRGALASFSDFIEELCLVDLPLLEVMSLWPDLCQNIHPKCISDHNPVSLSRIDSFGGHRPFKWFEYLVDDKAYVERVNEECCSAKGSGIGSLLRICKSLSKDWVSNIAGNSSDRIQMLEKSCSELERKIADDRKNNLLCEELKAARKSLWELIRREEREWIQKSRLNWAVAGDRNTKFFHLVASARRRSNFIGSVKVGGVLYNNSAEVKMAIETHFKNIYNVSNTLPLKLFDCEMGKISSDTASWLERPFSEEEVRDALAVLEPSKAPGPDGFNMGFLKKFWSCLVDDIMIFFNNFYMGDDIDKSFNQSFIVLIPKIRNPVAIEDFRPISLVGCVYKLLAKVLARHLSSIVDEFMGEQQFAFRPGMQILDCSLIANEVIDYTRSKGLEGVVFKVDFNKAYDTVDWGFLLLILEKLGFGSVWRQWILKCISSAFISVLINGTPTSPFAIRRGLRQGCPLSPLLFNIVSEALSAILKKASVYGYFKGFLIGKNAFEVSHLQFADDLILFCGASETQVRNVFRILKGFELAAGLKLNLKKTKLIGINMDKQKIDYWASLVKCQRDDFPCQYLGLPLGAKKNSLCLWDPIVDKFKTKLAGWKVKNLSFAGRVTLIKSVLNSLPVYYMSIFPMPAAVNSKISSLVARFLWGSMDNKSIHWIRWEDLVLPKSCGGLGLISFKTKNRALLNKWLWRFGVEKNSLWRKVINAKYGEDPYSMLPSNVRKTNKTWVWRNIVSPLTNTDDVFSHNIRLVVGDGGLNGQLGF